MSKSPASPPAGRHNAFRRLWAWPIALGLLSASGLLSALVSDAVGDAWSWFALGLPVLVMGYHGLRR